MRRSVHILALVSLFFVGVSAVAAAQPAAPVGPVTFTCGDTIVVAVFEDGRLRLRVDGVDYRLERAVSASGARYVGATPVATEFWNRGDAATLTIAGRTLPACRVAEAAPAAYVARGQEPGWLLTIERDRMVLLAAYGETRVETPVPARQVSEGGFTYAAATGVGLLRVEGAHRACQDAMSGISYPDTVTVTFGGVTLRGCGGTQAEALEGDWEVREIDGAAPVAGSVVTVRFGGPAGAEGRVSGVASCNNYTGTYTLSGEGLSFGPMAATRKACESALMQQEQRFLELLSTVESYAIRADGTLVLTAPDARTLTARRRF